MAEEPNCEEPMMKIHADYNGGRCELTICWYNLDQKQAESIQNIMKKRYDSMLSNYRTMKEIRESYPGLKKKQAGQQ